MFKIFWKRFLIDMPSWCGCRGSCGKSVCDMNRLMARAVSEGSEELHVRACVFENSNLSSCFVWGFRRALSSRRVMFEISVNGSCVVCDVWGFYNGWACGQNFRSSVRSRFVWHVMFGVLWWALEVRIREVGRDIVWIIVSEISVAIACIVGSFQWGVSPCCILFVVSVT